LKRAAIGILLILAVGVAAGSEFLGVRRSLAAQRASITAEWDELSDAFDRRAELIGSLAKMIQTAAGTPERVFADASEARTALVEAQTPDAKIAANARLMNAFARLYLAAEGRPKLTGSAAYRKLNEEIGTAESRVAVERRKYNDLLEHYNAQLQRFPNNVVGELCGLRRIDAYVRTEQDLR
jgi:LemA protein